MFTSNTRITLLGSKVFSSSDSKLSKGGKVRLSGFTDHLHAFTGLDVVISPFQVHYSMIAVQGTEAERKEKIEVSVSVCWRVLYQ